MRRVLVTNVTQYAGPGTVPVLLRAGYRVACHDPTFVDGAVRTRYAAAYPGVECLDVREPEEIFGVAGDAVDVVVCNDVFPITRNAIEDIAVEDLRATFEAVLVFPFRLTQLYLPVMKQRGSGTFVFITSARPRRPEPGFATPTAIRAGTTAFALALAKETAAYGIQVNVVAPNYLYSELYYPRAAFVDDPAGREAIAATVPAGRLGEPEEVGELVSFLASGRSPFTTGEVIGFTGGWP
ncbi:SDR family oxidoreductase [Dactylosporangium sp. AC04546]|uniref:SDR family oxidoreductase n=1 Tax=Dactylosporangium sp. AC04546 TaxID=2862460 RepID=UPI001EDFECA1|nr:SDR family oxidoreductase [Dactylosporangium sp. AC04546]WVK86565.1 SDR family oxidoreductase [Dactylosporangium sp. AC04546]